MINNFGNRFNILRNFRLDSERGLQDRSKIKK